MIRHFLRRGRVAHLESLDRQKPRLRLVKMDAPRPQRPRTQRRGESEAPVAAVCVGMVLGAALVAVVVRIFS
jgi:hypothetical protein